MTLHEIDKNIQAIIDNGFSVDEETGELLFTTADLDKLEMKRDEKVENIALAYLNEKSFITQMKEQIDNYKNRIEQHEKRLQKIANYLEFATGGEKFETPKCCVAYRKSERVIISTDIDKLPKKYVKKSISVTPDKMKLKADIKNGEQIDGVSIESNRSIIIK
ncbi:MAG: siphovirus Gp157 family protein [Oscillospiraceae bacterium]|nr:siphovirus Gp157 family protein [Candidatus Ruminococcus equi]